LILSRRATADAESLSQKWREVAAEVGLSGRQLDIFRLIQRDASDSAIQELRNRSEMIDLLEEEQRLRREIGNITRQERDGSFAITGVTANSLEAARISADLQTRRNHGIDDGDNAREQLFAALEDISSRLAERREAIEGAAAINGEVGSGIIKAVESLNFSILDMVRQQERANRNLEGVELIQVAPIPVGGF
jgi:hypothetical protein